MIGKLGWLTTKALHKVQEQQKNIQSYNDALLQKQKGTRSLCFLDRSDLLLDPLSQTPIEEAEEEESPAKEAKKSSTPRLDDFKVSQSASDIEPLGALDSKEKSEQPQDAKGNPDTSGGKKCKSNGGESHESPIH